MQVVCGCVFFRGGVNMLRYYFPRDLSSLPDVSFSFLAQRQPRHMSPPTHVSSSSLQRNIFFRRVLFVFVDNHHNPCSSFPSGRLTSLYLFRLPREGSIVRMKVKTRLNIHTRQIGSVPAAKFLLCSLYYANVTRALHVPEGKSGIMHEITTEN